jgi:hypothetical protein
MAINPNVCINELEKCTEPLSIPNVAMVTFGYSVTLG